MVVVYIVCSKEEVLVDEELMFKSNDDSDPSLELEAESSTRRSMTVKTILVID